MKVELIVNMAAICINLGIVLASCFILVMDATFLAPPPKTPPPSF
jgi:hypothetical protein